jgi:class 3 adenylate cyclase
MPLYLDWHDLGEGVTAEDVALAHIRDLQVQDRYGVRYLSYWFDYNRQASFCLVDAPSKAVAEAVHREAHGGIASRIIEVDPRQIHEFLGAIPQAPPGEPYVETAFRAILFTDVEGSTALTQRLGDAMAMRLLRRHDDIVRTAVKIFQGTEVKHTGDGIMASFGSAFRALECAIAIQRNLAEHNAEHPEEAIAIRTGLAAGEPVTESGDLFGSCVQLAARLCARSRPGNILVSTAVYDLVLGHHFAFGTRKKLMLRGFNQPIHAYEVEWRPAPRLDGVP